MIGTCNTIWKLENTVSQQMYSYVSLVTRMIALDIGLSYVTSKE